MTTYREDRRTDMAARGVGRLLAQFASSTKLATSIAIKLERKQALENAIWALIDDLSLDSTKSWVLDLIGAIVGRGRANLANDDYRIALRAQIAILRSWGTLPDLFEVFALSAPTYTLRQYTYAPSGTVAWLVESSAGLNVAVVWENLKQIRSLGRFLQFGYVPEAPAAQARYGWSGDATLNTGTNGAGWSGDTTYGGKAWAIYEQT